MLADFLDDISKIDARLICCSVVLMISIAWIFSGCYTVLNPDKTLERNRRSAPEPVWELFDALRLTSLTAIKIMGYIILIVGLIILMADVYLFAHSELMG